MNVQKLTKEQALAVSGFTGILCCKFSDLHEEIERRIGRPIFTHEMAIDSVWENEIKPAFKDDFFAMIPVERKGGAQ